MRREPGTSSSLALICVTCSWGEDNIFSITPVVTCERIPHYSIYSCGFIFNSVICDLRENVLVLKNWHVLTHRGLCILTHVHNPTPAQKLISQGAGLAQTRTMVFEHSRRVALSEDSLCELHGIAKSYHIWNLIGAWQTQGANTQTGSWHLLRLGQRKAAGTQKSLIWCMIYLLLFFLMRAKSNTTSKYFVQSIIFRIIHFFNAVFMPAVGKRKNNESKKQKISDVHQLYSWAYKQIMYTEEIVKQKMNLNVSTFTSYKSCRRNKVVKGVENTTYTIWMKVHLVCKSCCPWKVMAQNSRSTVFVLMLMREKAWNSAVIESAEHLTFTHYVTQHSVTMLCDCMCGWVAEHFHFPNIPFTSDYGIFRRQDVCGTVP